MRVVFTHDVADDTGGLSMGFVRGDPQTVHSKKYSSVYRLKSVPDIRKGSAHDDAHGVIDVGVLHLIVDLVLYHSLVFQ